ncbi:MAG TPA: hypothetical protein VGS00_09695 [Thermoanaerobaculia bacterium]|nr:hypothetical protein [Thermoanaerobaculia bacterium]
MKRRGAAALGRLLDTLERAKLERGQGAGVSAASTLGKLRRRDMLDADAAIRLHEAALFLAAYPHSAPVKARAEAMLGGFDRRVRRLEEAGEDLSAFDGLETGGIAGTTVATEFSWDIARWLVRRQAGRVEASWEAHELSDRLGAGWPRFLPLLEEEALADAGVPYLEWLDAARGDLEWLLSRFERLPLPQRRKAELFDAQGVVVSWTLGRSPFTRTLLRKPGPPTFFHREPLLSRRDVSFREALAGPRLPARRLSRREAGRVLDMARGGTAARYREFYGFTHGDPATALAARPGRGVEIFFFGVRKDNRLPLRATYSALIFKSAVPVAYFEGLSFFERMEVGFNVYYTFREGESAWLYAQMLKLCHQVTGARSFSIDPYQIGRENDEAIESGAFWFYRKLGFRPTGRAVAMLVAREEERMKRQPGYRTSAATLRRIATGNLLYEVPSNPKSKNQNLESEWDRFHVRRIGLAVNRRMAREFGGEAERIRRASESSVARKLGVRLARLSEAERHAFADFALALDLIPGLARWSGLEKKAAIEVIRAKAGRSETRYLHLSQRHARLRASLIRLGSVLG